MAAAHGGDAEHGAAGLPGLVQVAVLVFRLHIDGGLLEINVKLAEPADPLADIALQAGFKGTAVLSLQDDFAQLQQKNFFHGFILIFK